MSRSSRESSRQLFRTAMEQGGYFTAKQAIAAGYDYPHLVYHVSVGNFERVAHGLYRLPDAPIAEYDDFIWLTLWSRDRQDVPQGVVSHDSALFFHDLSDIIPRKTHLTVPPSFRKQAPGVCVLHRAVLLPAEVGECEGFRVTKPLRTLLDAAAHRGFSQELLDQAVEDALARGSVLEERLVAAARGDPRYRRLLLNLGFPARTIV